MAHPTMIACGLSLLHRAKFHRMSKHLGLGLGKYAHKIHGHKLMKGRSALKKDPDPESLKMTTMPVQRALKFR